MKWNERKTFSRFILFLKNPCLFLVAAVGLGPINDAFVEAIEQFGNKSYEILYVTGEVHYDKVMDAVKQREPE